MCHFCIRKKNAVNVALKREEKQAVGNISLMPFVSYSQGQEGGVALPGHMFLIMREMWRLIAHNYKKALD